MSRRPPDDLLLVAPARPQRRRHGSPFRRVVRALAASVAIGVVAGGCALGERPTLESTPTAVGVLTGDPAIDAVLTRLDSVRAAVFTASYTSVLSFGSVTRSVTVSQDGSEPTDVRRSVTIGDVRYISTREVSSTCSVSASQCSDGIDPARVSDTGVTPEFAFGDMAKRLRRDALARIGTSVASTRNIAGRNATCVDVRVDGGTKQYCVFDDGVLARYVGGDATIDVTGHLPTVDESLFVV